MKSSKLLKVIRTLSKEDRKEFTLFLSSPYFHRDPKSSETNALWEYIKAGAEQSTGIYWKKEKVYQFLYPNDVFVKGKLEKIMTKLFSLLTSFIVQKKQEQAGEIDDLLSLGQYYIRHDLTAIFEKTLLKLRRLIAQSTKQDVTFFYHQFLVEQMVTEYKSLHNNRKIDLNLLATHDRLDRYYVLTKLEYACQLLSIHLFIIPLDLGDRLDFLDRLLKDIAEKYLDTPILNLYFHAYQLLRFFDKKEEGYYESFYKLLVRYEDDLESDQLKPLRTLIRNYSISHHLKGSEGYLQKAFHLYCADLESGYLYYNDFILPGTLNNIVSLGLRMKKYEWVSSFLEAHRSRIYGMDSAEVSYQFNMAHYCFHKKEYENALEYLARTYDDQYYKISGRRLEIMIYYCKKSVLLDDKINAFKIYIYRLPKQSISEKQKEGNGNFIDLLKQICLPRTFKSISRIEKLLKKIDQTKRLAERLWLKEILEELK